METCERYLTLEEAAGVARVSPSTLRSWIRLGRLRAFRPGRRLLLVEAELHAFVQRALRQPPSATAETPELAGPGASCGDGDDGAAFRSTE